jgi:hypothetical protein
VVVIGLVTLVMNEAMRTHIIDAKCYSVALVLVLFFFISLRQHKMRS